MRTQREQSIALGEIALTIKKQQETEPEACAETLQSIVNSELRHIEKESGCNLDELAEEGAKMERTRQLHPNWAKWLHGIQGQIRGNRIDPDTWNDT